MCAKVVELSWEMGLFSCMSQSKWEDTSLQAEDNNMALQIAACEVLLETWHREIFLQEKREVKAQ